jgi:hypothetical protein
MQQNEGSQIAATTGSSRTWDNTITVAWTPSTTTAELDVVISASSATMVILQFTPGTEVQSVDFNDGTNSSTGTFYAHIFSDGASGILVAQNWHWAVGDTKGYFSGTIGQW